MRRAICIAILIVSCAVSLRAARVNIIFDTDIGNDVDDVLALSILHALQSRGACRLLAVTVTKPHELAGPFVDVMNTFYGRAEIPIGCIRPLPNEDSKFLSLADAMDDGRPRYPHKLKRGSDAEAPSHLLRRILAAQPDQSVTLVQVGYFSNFTALLDAPADEFSSLTGRDLVRAKVKLLSVMAGAFQKIGTNNHFLEFNVIKDIPSARILARDWPTPIMWSGFEIGIALPYPAQSIEHDFSYVLHHPAAEAYYLYNPPPHQRPTWDLTAVLYAVLSEREYFDLSQPGKVTIDTDGFTRFTPEADGRDRHLILQESQIARVREAMVELASEPPNRRLAPK